MTVNNLYVTYDDDAMPHFHVGDEEVSKDVWEQMHPHFRKGKDSGRNRDSDSGLVAEPGEAGGADGPNAEVRQGISENRYSIEAGIERHKAGQAGHGVGQRQRGPE